MDAVIDASNLAGLPGSEAHVIRTPGGRATEEAIRSLVLASEWLGARSWVLVQHTSCGMALLDETVTGKLWSGRAAASAPAGFTAGDHAGSRAEPAAASVGRLALSTPDELLTLDVARIRQHASTPQSIPIHAYRYDSATRLYYAVALIDHA
jgi:carbonic anhydrase